MEYLPVLKSIQTRGGVSEQSKGDLNRPRRGDRPFLRATGIFCTSLAAALAVPLFTEIESLPPWGAALAVAFAVALAAWAVEAFRARGKDGSGFGRNRSADKMSEGFKLMSALVDAMPASLLVKDKDRRYILVNQTMCDWFGWNSGEIVGKTFDDVLPERHAEIVREQDDLVFQTGTPQEYCFEVELADGRWIQLLSNRFPIRSTDGEVIAIGIFNVDVTDHERTRQEYVEVLRERDRQAAMFKDFFEALPFPAAVKGIDGRFLSVNSQLLEWHASPAEEIIGRTIGEILDPEIAALSIELDNQVLTAKEARYDERTLTFPDGSDRVVSIHRFPLMNSDGEILALGLFNIDVTEQRAAERLLKDANAELERLVGERTQELEQANSELTRTLDELKATTDLLIESDRMASLGSMVAGMAHEINTPIGVGVTAASLVRDKVDQLKADVGAGTLTRDGMDSAMSVLDEASDVMLRNMTRADSLIRSLKQVAVDQSNVEKRDVDVEQYIREIELSIAPVLKQASITVEADCRRKLILNLQPGPLAQVMTNIMMNSVHHAYPDGNGGLIKVGTDLTDDGAVIRFQDFGVGMDQETVGQAFVPFFTTRRNKGGTGLGLSIVYNVVRSVLGGSITCVSEPGKGTVFTVILPLSCVADQAE